jgi:predicted Zn-dependent protease with MMP-like domain
MRTAAPLFAAALWACTRTPPPPVEAPAPPAAAAHDAGSAAKSAHLLAPGRAHDGSDALKPCPTGAGTPLERAVRAYDDGDFDNALACAAQASTADPSSPDAHAERAAALTALDRLDEARVAYARALALNPDHADALLGAADLYLTRLPSSHDFNELGLAYAARGYAGARHVKDRQLQGQFALVQATALNNLGRGRAAIRMANEALAVYSTTPSGQPSAVDAAGARFEKASALWELCRFGEARAELEELLASPDREAAAHYYLGLIAEREGDAQKSQRELSQAHRLAPEDYAEPLDISPADFRALLDRLEQQIPEDMRKDLSGVDVTSQDLPDLEDLIANDPPLSPSIIGLFRGPALGEPCPPARDYPGACRAIVIYRKNLLRAVHSREELEAQARVTLIHEIGHLRGENDTELAARGLE